MKDEFVENIVRTERDRELPRCPTNLEAKVLRRVRLAAGEEYEISGFDWIFTFLPSKSMAFGVLALALILSISSTMVVAASSANAATAQDRAVTALDFGVFKETSFFNLDN
jgi:hypothetical protein